MFFLTTTSSRPEAAYTLRHVERINSRRTVNKRLLTNGKKLTEDYKHVIDGLVNYACDKIYEEKYEWRINYRMIELL